jgi:hypothetical protein
VRSRRDDHQDDVEHVQNRKHDESDKNQAENAGDETVNHHRDLEVQRFLSVRIDLGGISAFHQPDDERPADVAERGYDEPS